MQKSAQRIPLAAAIVAILALLAIVFVAEGLLETRGAHAQAAAPSDIEIRNTGNPGEVVVSWNPVPRAQGYQVGWANERAVTQAVNQQIPWQERFAYTNLRPVVNSHTVQNLAGGERYAFVIGTLTGANTFSWSAWQFHTPAPSPVCPGGGTATGPRFGPRPTITFGGLNWNSAELQTRIAQYIVEEGYGYPTRLVLGSALSLFQALQRGDVDVLMEIWLPNQEEAWNIARADGAVISLGRSLDDDWQSAFVIPKYVQEQNPGLISVEDLKNPRYKRLFATESTAGKARLVSCPSSWPCASVNARQVEGYGLSDHVHIVNAPDGAALDTDLKDAYGRKEPWLGYQWASSGPALLLDLVRLREPAYTDQCRYTTEACAYETATVLIAANPDLLIEAPDVAVMLRNWDFNHATHRAVARWQQANANSDPEDSAMWWLQNNAHIWRNWVTPEAANNIRNALNAGRIPEGWPE